MFSDPKEILNQLTINHGMIVADIGAGSGFYTLAVSDLVGSNGKVYAVDVQKELLNRLSTEAHKLKKFNIEVLWGDVEKLGGTRIRDFLVDLAIVANVLFQIENKVSFAQELERIIKPGGRVLIVDWTESYNNMGPQKDMVFNKDSAVKLLSTRGFTVEKDIDAGSHHYGVLFKRS